MAPADPDAKIACPTPQHLQVEIDNLAEVLALGEKEETWEKLEKALYRFGGVVRGGGYKHQPMFNEGVGRKRCGIKIAEYMLSDRGRLAGSAIELLQAFAPRLGVTFAPLVQVYFDPLIKLFGRPNKVFLKRAEKCLLTIIDNCHIATIVIELKKGLYDEAATCRRLSSIGIERALGQGGWDREVWSERSLSALEEGLRRMATDKDPEVRQTGKRVWVRFMDQFPERVDDFSAPLTPTIRRYLNLPAGAKAAAPRPKAAKAPAPVAPTARQPIASGSTTTLASKPEHSVKAQHHRVAALATKPSRATLKPSAAAEAPALRKDQHAGSSRAPQSPPKPFEASAGAEPKTPHPRANAQYHRTPDHAGSHNLDRPVVEMSGRPDALAAPALGRSFSHNVLSKHDSVPESRSNREPARGRPVLPQSYSTTALPFDSHVDPLPPLPTRPSRFATGPVRIVRPVPMPATDEVTVENPPISVDGFFYTPSGATVLRGPVRPPPPIGHSRRPMGQAQRRVVTAPETGETDKQSILTKTPAARRVLSRSVKERVVELDERAASVSPGKMASTLPATVPLPPSPRDDTSSPARGSTQVEEPPLTLKTTVEPVDPQSDARSSPPRASAGHYTPIDIAAKIPLPETAPEELDPTPNDDVRLPTCQTTIIESKQNTETAQEEATESLEHPDTRPASTEESNGSAAAEHLPTAPDHLVPAHSPTNGSDPTAEPETGDAAAARESGSLHDDPLSASKATALSSTYDVPVGMIGSHEDAEPHTAMAEAVETAPAGQSDAHASVLEPREPQPTTSSGPTIAIVKKPEARPLAARVVSGRGVKPSQDGVEPTAPHVQSASSAPSAVVPPRKPPVPRAAAVSARPVRPVERKHFRPVTAAESAAKKQNVHVQPAAAPGPAPADNSSKSAASTHPSGAMARSRAVSAQSGNGFTTGQAKAATTATAVKSAAPAPSRSDAGSTRSTKSSTLLAPTKASALRATAAAHPQSSIRPAQAPPPPSTSSSALPPVRKEKIKLKAALPSFRPVRHAAPTTTTTTGSNATVPTATQATRGPSARIRPESIPLPISPLKELAAPIETSSRSPALDEKGNGRAKVRPEAMPLPASPGPASMAELVPPPASPGPTANSESESASASMPSLNDLGLPLPLSDRMPMRPRSSLTSSRSKASTAPESSDDDEAEDDLTGVTFKTRSSNTTTTMDMGIRRPKVIQQTTGTGTEKDLIEFSAPANRSLSNTLASTSTPIKNSTTPKYTPNRRALGFMDANVRSPLVTARTHSA